jgi:hypothetical protein
MLQASAGARCSQPIMVPLPASRSRHVTVLVQRTAEAFGDTDNQSVQAGLTRNGLEQGVTLSKELLIVSCVVKTSLLLAG